MPMRMAVAVQMSLVQSIQSRANDCKQRTTLHATKREAAGNQVQVAGGWRGGRQEVWCTMKTKLL